MNTTEKKPGFDKGQRQPGSSNPGSSSQASSSQANSSQASSEARPAARARPSV
jgi:hypothetical protein